jgi:hypothetical protein
VTGKKSIGDRLENWARWATQLGRSGGADCMTGAICEALRKAALGDVWSGHDIAPDVQDRDAVAIERGMRFLPDDQRILLWWCYIKQQHPGYVARRMSFQVKEFVERFRAAQEAIEDIVDGGNR